MVRNNPPELTFYDDDTGSFFRFVEPDSVMVVPSGSGGVRYDGLDVEPPSDPFQAINRYFDVHDSGTVAGWVSYDFARLNPLHSLGTTSPSNDPGPLLVLAHYPERRGCYRTDDLPAGDVSLGRLTPEQDRSAYARSIRNIQTLINHGYVYQINYSQRFTAPLEGSLLNLLEGLDDSILPPFSVHGRMGDYEFLSLSPERFVRVDDRRIETEPIKGTRPRGSDAARDRSMREQLRASEKDAAEHMMIVDLERNDLNQVCEPGSVHVPSLSRLETFPTVHHLVSTVAGTLRDGVGFGDLIEKLFPGGSVTGCPKRIAVRVIDFLENRARGLYTGTVGFWDLDESYADWNIAIRTLQRYRERAWWDSGGGIVIDSSPSAEYSESLDKVELIEQIRGTARFQTTVTHG